MRGVKILFFLFLFGCFACCQNNSLNSESKLFGFIYNPESGYLKKKHISGLDVNLLYKPTNLMIQQEMSGRQNIQLEDSLRKKYEPYMYFTLSISNNGKDLLNTFPQDRTEFGALVHQLSFGVDRFVHLVINQHDTINLLDYSTPRLYEMSKMTSILLVYPRINNVNNKDSLNLYLNGLTPNISKVKFKIPLEVVRNYN